MNPLVSSGSQAAEHQAFEICYAILRLAPSLPDRILAEHLERWALGVMAPTATRDFPQAVANLHVLEYYVRLGMEGGTISVDNSQVILRELWSLASILNEPIQAEQINLETILAERKQRSQSNLPDVGSIGPIGPIRPTQQAVDKIAPKGPSNAESTMHMDAPIRQSAILDKVRQFGNCRLKDIQGILPNVSERTLRYDLQGLISQNKIDRIGEGGPSTFYRAK
ncbi:MAG: hypothetical protein HY978_04430 [Candidatus Liptonbacteria bacterium]|nr:hypothetical protein [Candidatus Liptonbacteria bacterium]